ncbi:MAG: phage major capsid protein [Planctomycetia bacterium]|nr:phage major capsid protein [Planctomycetia bacterium]
MFVQLLKEFLGRKAGERLSVSDEDGNALIAQGLAQPVTDDLITPAVSKALESAFGKFSDAMNLIVEKNLKAFADAQAQSHKHAVPALFGVNGHGDPKKNFGDWLLHVAKNDEAYLEKTYGSVRHKAPLAEGSGVTGGYLVPTEFSTRLLEVAAEETFMRKRAFVQPMNSAALQLPYLDITSVPSTGTSALFGGVQLSWKPEAGTVDETEPKFKMLELKAHELSGYAVSSNVMLQDSAIGLERFLFTLFGKAIGWFEEFAFLQGNGAGKPLGVLNAPAALTVNRNAANQVKYVDVASMLSKLLPSSQRKAVWTVHPYAIAQLVQLADAGGNVVWVPSVGGAQDRVPGTLFGLPVITTEKVPALGAKGDVMLIDPSLYVIGDRQQIEIAASEHVNFLKNQMTWRVVERVDGQPWVERPITLQDGVSTVSPFIIRN